MNRRIIRILFVALFYLVSLSAVAQSVKWKDWEVQGDTLYEKQEFAEAARLYSKVLDANTLKDGQYEDQGLYNTLYKRAVCYYSTKEYDKALKDLELFGPAYPSAPQPKLLKAFIYRELDDVDNQLTSLNEAMALQPPNPDFLKWRGLLYIQKEQFEPALVDMLRARQFQDDSEIETYLGLAYFNLDKKDSAHLSFTKAIELDATFIAPYLYGGSMALQEGDYELALEYLNLALRLDSRNKEALFYKGVALIELKRLDEGCKCLNRAFYAGYDDAGDYLAEYCFSVEN
ncbi:MAG: tetratricopeptide repeat protein [Cytophagales bacterium]|nr:tetratricopeptide repeat protein [Cytophagales bacterium]